MHKVRTSRLMPPAIVLVGALAMLLVLSTVSNPGQLSASGPQSGGALPRLGPQGGASVVAILRAKQFSQSVARSTQDNLAGPGGGVVQQPLNSGLLEVAHNQSLEEIVNSAIGGQSGTWGIYIKHLGSGDGVAINADTQMNVASLYKLQVLYAAYADERAGQLSLDETLPEGWTVSDALRAMITVSDQDATFALLRRIGTDRVNAMMSELGLGQSYVTDWGYSTARETGMLLEMIASGQAVDEAASRDMLALLFDQQINDRIPAYLPGGIVAHKTGELPGIRNDAGIIYGPSGPYVMVVVTSGLADEDGAASAIAAMSHDVYAYFN